MAPKLYALDLSPPCRAVMMLCELQKIPIEYITVDVLAKENLKEDYVKRNPMHTVPTLEDGDLVIHDSHVILTYLTDKYGKSQWYPKDLKQRALVDQKLYFDAHVFTKLKGIIGAALHEDVRNPSEKVINEVVQTYEFLEQFLSRTKYIAGDSMTIADISLIATLSSLHYIVPVDDKFPKASAWMKEMEKQQFYQKQNVIGRDKYRAFFKKYLDIMQ